MSDVFRLDKRGLAWYVRFRSQSHSCRHGFVMKNSSMGSCKPTHKGIQHKASMTWKNNVLALLERSLKPVPQELNELDWKCELSTNSKKLAHHICAFANNRGGGVFAFGINDKDASFTDISKETIEEICQKLAQIAGNSLSISIGLEHDVQEYEGHTILFVYVPEQATKPVHMKGQLMEAFCRSAGHTTRMTENQIRAMMAQTQGLEFEKKPAMEHLTVDLVLKKLDYKALFEHLGETVPSTGVHTVQRLANYGLCRAESNGQWAITNMGAILFANSLPDFPNLYARRVIIRRYSGTNNLQMSFVQKESTRGYALEFEEMVKFIMMNLPAQEEIAVQRKQNSAYPEIAIRELLANALVHQDFNITGMQITVEIYTNRVVITNPGAPLNEITRLIDMPPQSRNEKLAQMLFLLRLCERRGSGIDRAMDAIEAMYLPAPRFEREDSYTRITLYPAKETGKMTKDERIKACYYHACLQHEKGEETNNQTVRTRFNLNTKQTSMASRIIGDTVEAGYIKPTEQTRPSKKFASYIPHYA